MLEGLKSQRAKLERDRYSTDLWAFLRDVLGYSDLVEAHREIVNLLIDPGQYKLILAPRDSFKSSICTVGFPLWRLSQDPNLRVMIASKTDARARMFLAEIKRHIETGRFKEIYGDWKFVPGWAESTIVLPHRTKPLKEPSIATGGVNSPQTGGHYDLIIADDLHDERNVASELERQKVILYWKTLFPILEPYGTLAVIGTRWHWSDLYNTILKNERVEYI